MHTDYVDNWDDIPAPLQSALEPVIRQMDEAADALFDRRLNLAFEAAVKEISIPGVVALTVAVRALRDLIAQRIVVSGDGKTLVFDGEHTVTVYDLPVYTPCLYLSQLSQRLVRDNVRVWKADTLRDILDCAFTMARCAPPRTETARVVAAAIYDLIALDEANKTLVIERQSEIAGNATNEATILAAVLSLLGRGQRISAPARPGP